MVSLNKKQLEKLTLLKMQSVRNLVHNGILYAVFITNLFRKIGWMTEIDGKFYSNVFKLKREQPDDIIDYYLSTDQNAKESIDAILCQEK